MARQGTGTGLVLAKVKHSPSLSEETEAFTAEVQFQGRAIGSARNGGTGGSTLVQLREVPVGLLEAAAVLTHKARTAMAAEFPEWAGDVNAPANLAGLMEEAVDYLFGLWLEAKVAARQEATVQRWLAQQVAKGYRSAVVGTAGDYLIRMAGRSTDPAAVLAHTRQKYPTLTDVRLFVDGRVVA